MYYLDKDITEVLSKYKLLKYTPYNNCLSGDIELLSDTGKYIDIFNLEIFIPDDFPKSFPKVIETEEKIPRIVSRHIIPKDNTLCLVVQIEELLICQNGITLLWFIDNVLIPRLCEEFRVNNGEKYQKEYSHDFGGTWEFLMKKLEVENPELVLKFIEALANKKKPKGNALCLCGSGNSYRLCHKKSVVSLQHLNNKILKILLDLLLKQPYKGVNL
jgi:hypothetical protein